MNRLEEILAVKRAEVERLQPIAARIIDQAFSVTDFRGFRAALQRSDDQLAIIAEVKRASPSAGTIAAGTDPGEKAKDYQQQGAEAVSVLTDKTFFQGAMADLAIVHDAVTIPVLRKDFIIDRLQIVQAVAGGADAVLLIVAALPGPELLKLTSAAAELHLDTLIEVHTEEELQRAIDVGATIIGINNRDLTTFEVDLSVTEELSELVPNDVVLVSESGYKTAEDVRLAHQCGVNAVLVGEALMRGDVTIDELRAV
ncbi:MAG TPA: indole-3-glycerol phosphate synthase TrpC [Chthoniobacterales bacterium]|nr:indole-3-glycerol phosphate synthase TrpC [Chthoniobacterales bacterium]